MYAGREENDHPRFVRGIDHKAADRKLAAGVIVVTADQTRIIDPRARCVRSRQFRQIGHGKEWFSSAVRAHLDQDWNGSAGRAPYCRRRLGRHLLR